MSSREVFLECDHDGDDREQREDKIVVFKLLNEGFPLIKACRCKETDGDCHIHHSDEEVALQAIGCD